VFPDSHTSEINIRKIIIPEDRNNLMKDEAIGFMGAILIG
jgi:hypothetical protein